MVAHQEQLAVRDDPLLLVQRVLGRLGLAVLLEDIRLDQLRAVQEDLAVADLDRVAADADHPLDVRRAVLLLPRDRRAEDHDVAPLVRVESRRQLVDQHVLVRLQGRLHRLLPDLVRLRDEGLDDKEDDEGEDERLDDLEEAPDGGASGHKSGSIGCGPSEPPEGRIRLADRWSAARPPGAYPTSGPSLTRLIRR